MKENLRGSGFKAWGEQAAKDRDSAIKQVKKELDAALAAEVIEKLREKLNWQWTLLLRQVPIFGDTGATCKPELYFKGLVVVLERNSCYTENCQKNAVQFYHMTAAVAANVVGGKETFR